MLVLGNAPEESQDRRQEFEAAQIQLLYRQTPSGILGGLFLALVLTALLWDEVPYVRLMVWLGTFVVLQAFRFVLYLTYWRVLPSREAAPQWGRLFDISNLSIGVAWGLLAVFLFPKQSLMLQYLVSFCIAGLSCAITVLYSLRTSSYLPGVLAMLLPLAGRYFYEGSSTQIGISFAIFILAIVLIMSTRTNRSLISDYIQLKFEKQHLSNELDEQKADGQALGERLGTEIAKREEVQEALRNNEERFQLLVETAKDIIWTVDLSLHYTYVSPSVQAVLGYTVEEIMNLDPFSTLTPPSKERIRTAFAEEFAAEQEGNRGHFQSRTEEIEQYCKDGSIRWMEITTTFLRNEVGEPTGILGISRDITERKMIDQVRTDFATMASHELRTPLTSILGHSELLLLQDHLSPEEQQDSLKIIHRQALHLKGIVADLLDVSRIESGVGIPLNLVQCDISAIILNVISLLKEESQKHKFEIDLPEEPIVLMADKHRIWQLFRNVMGNAVRYSPNGGPILLKCEQFDDFYLFSVQDHGIGMTSRQAKMAFEKFYRVNRADTAASGTGLGMTIVKYIVEARGGRVWIESKYGIGTTIKFTFPIRFGVSILDGGWSEKDSDRG